MDMTFDLLDRRRHSAGKVVITLCVDNEMALPVDNRDPRELNNLEVNFYTDPIENFNIPISEFAPKKLQALDKNNNADGVGNFEEGMEAANENSVQGSQAGDVSLASSSQDALSGIFNSLADQQSNFGNLVSDLRGDGHNFMKALTGDLDLPTVLRLGHRINEDTVKVSYFILYFLYCYLQLFNITFHLKKKF